MFKYPIGKQKRERNETEETNRKHIIKCLDLRSNISIITSNVNGLNTPIRQRLAGWIRQANKTKQKTMSTLYTIVFNKKFN